MANDGVVSSEVGVKDVVCLPSIFSGRSEKKKEPEIFRNQFLTIINCKGNDPSDVTTNVLLGPSVSTQLTHHNLLPHSNRHKSPNPCVSYLGR